MKIKKRIKKIVAPFVKVVKRILKPFTSRFRNWCLGVVREAISTQPNQVSELVSRIESNIAQLHRVQPIQASPQETSSTIEPLLLSFLMKKKAGEPENQIPFGIPITQELFFVRHPILKYFFASSSDFSRVSKFFLQSQQINISHYLLNYPKKGVAILDLDPIDGYHTLTMASNMCSDSIVLLPSNPITELNLECHSLTQFIRPIVAGASREEIICEAFAQTRIDLIVANQHQTLVDDFRAITNSPIERFPTILFEFAPTNAEEVTLLIEKICAKHPTHQLFQINRLGHLVSAPDLRQVSTVSHFVFTRLEEN